MKEKLYALTSLINGGEWLASSPSRFNPQDKTPVPTEKKAGWVSESIW
jgi:hypothetical protein